MKIMFIGHIPKTGYSGGRYLSLCLASCLSTEHEVSFYTNNTNNQIYRECFSNYENLKIKSFHYNDNKKYDICFIIPNGDGDINFHKALLNFSKLKSQKTYLFNFESENWWNSVSPYKKNMDLWEPWKMIAENCDGVCSISNEGTKWAKDFYKTNKFFTISGPINSPYFDKIKNVEKQKKIIFMTRIGNNSEHKGLKFLFLLNNPFFENFELFINCAGGKFNQKIKNQIIDKFAENNISVAFGNNICEQEKVKLLKQSEYLFFPTEFEGLGIPPIEAMYCDTKVICSDLQVLRETGADWYDFFSLNDVTSFEKTLKNMKKQKINNKNKYTFENVLENFNKLMEIK